MSNHREGEHTIEMVGVVMDFHGGDEASIDELAGVLAQYVVRVRGEPGCRTADLWHSATTTGRFTVVEKWTSADHQRHHFDAESTIVFAQHVMALVDSPPRIDLLDPISAHDLT